jgi:Zn finger protein HypA/HybF involved in hydrogenase expression
LDNDICDNLLEEIEGIEAKLLRSLKAIKKSGLREDSMMENENEILEVHCLKCDHIYPEEKPQTKVCPNCGNEDMMQTVYLVSEEISKLYDED